MRERVVADLVTLVPDPPDEIRIALRVLPDEEERRLHVGLLQLVEDVVGVWLGRPVVDGQRNLLRFVSAARDHE